MKFLFLGVPASPSAPAEPGLPAPAGGQTACGPLRVPDALAAALRPLLDAEANCQIDTSPPDFSAQAAASDEVRMDTGAFNGSCFCLKASEGEGARD